MYALKIFNHENIMSKISPILVAAFCSVTLLSSAKSLATDRPTVCVSDWPVWQYARVADFAKFNVVNESYRTCINRYAKGKFDIAFLALYDVVRLERENQAATKHSVGKIVFLTDYSNGGDWIVAKSGYDFKRKSGRYALQLDSVSFNLLYMYAQKVSLDLSQIVIVNVRSDNIINALKYGAFDVVIGWGGNVDQAARYGYKTVATSTMFPSKLFDVIVVNDNFLRNHKKEVQEFIKIYTSAVGSSTAQKQIAKLNNVPLDKFISNLSKAKIFTKNKESLAHWNAAISAAAETQQMLIKYDYLIQGGRAKPSKIITIRDLFSDQKYW